MAPCMARVRGSVHVGVRDPREDGTMSLSVLSARLQQTALAVQYLDTSARIELFSLLSIACCIIGGENSSYMLATNLTVAMLGLMCSRGGSEAQLAGLCVFAIVTTITDVRRGPLQPVAHCVFPPHLSHTHVADCSHVHGAEWLERALECYQRFAPRDSSLRCAGRTTLAPSLTTPEPVWTQIVMKLAAATSASRMSATFSQLTGEEPMGLPEEDNFPVRTCCACT